MLAKLEASLSRRGLVIMGIDGHGDPARWESPYLIDVIVTPPDRMYRYDLEAVLRPLVGLVEVKEMAEMVEEIRSLVIAGGRRHAMAGSLES